MRLIFLIITFLISFSCNKEVEKKVQPQVPSSSSSSLSPMIVKMVLESKLMSRDSGEEITSSFLSECIEEKTESYIKFYCDDLLWPYYVKILNNEVIYFTEDGASVENRKLYKIQGDELLPIKDPLPKVLTTAKIAELLNKKYPGSNYSAERIDKIAHSHYRVEFPKESGSEIIILAGELGSDNEHSYKEITRAKWNGEAFELLDI